MLNALHELKSVSFSGGVEVQEGQNTSLRGNWRAIGGIGKARTRAAACRAHSVFASHLRHVELTAFLPRIFLVATMTWPNGTVVA